MCIHVNHLAAQMFVSVCDCVRFWCASVSLLLLLLLLFLSVSASPPLLLSLSLYAAALSPVAAEMETASAQKKTAARRGPDSRYLLPLIYMPVLSMIPVVFRKQPRVRNALFWGGLFTALGHGAYLLTVDLPDNEEKPKPRPAAETL